MNIATDLVSFFSAVQMQAFNLIWMCSLLTLRALGFFSARFRCFGMSIKFISSLRTNKKRR